MSELSEEGECAHKWITKLAGGAPDMAESYERVTYCDLCGEEYGLRYLEPTNPEPGQP